VALGGGGRFISTEGGIKVRKALAVPKGFVCGESDWAVGND
jgi:hypothetical protein